MDFSENNEYICPICLDRNGVLDWNNELFAYCGVTYKDCYYKYTQLEYPVTDTFTAMLCHDCSNGLQNVHTFISKALESHELLQNKYMVYPTVDNPAATAGGTEYIPTEFETILVEKVEIDHVTEQDSYVCDNSENEFKIKKSTTATIKKSVKIKDEYISMATSKREISKNDLPLHLNSSYTTAKSKTRKLLSIKELDERRNHNSSLIKDVPLDDKLEEECTTTAHEVNKKYWEKNTPRMCSFCSKIIKNIYDLKNHEETHVENRKRNETCDVCGVKFYDKRSLYSHMLIHKENRERRYKCEFCDKAFYNRGALNVHQRIHLGQMIPCKLCPKEFFRRIDLQRHMFSHSAVTINSDMKKKSKYSVRCKHCDKLILTTKYKSHLAAHLNEPLMKCSVCSKEFFYRTSCVRHVKKVHQKTSEEYNDFITMYTKKRLSHLFLKQNAEVQNINESIIDE